MSWQQNATLMAALRELQTQIQACRDAINELRSDLRTYAVEEESSEYESEVESVQSAPATFSFAGVS